MTVLDSLTEDCRQAGVSPDLLMMAGFVLAQLYDEEPVGAIETYCRTLARNGQTWADESKVLTAIEELERVGLLKDGKVVEKKPPHGEVKEVKRTQRSLFDAWC